MTRSERFLAVAVTLTLAVGVVVAAQPSFAQQPAAASSATTSRVITAGPGAGHRAAPRAELPLIESRAETVLPAAVPDPGPLAAVPDGEVASPRHEILIADAPDGDAIGLLPTTSIAGAPTAVPVIASRSGWLLVLLPSRPANSTGWIRQSEVTTAQSTWSVEVSIRQRTLTVTHDGDVAGVFSVAVGAAKTPTPVTRTFVAALESESGGERSVLGPWVLALAAHSPVLATFDGGPGTIGIHGWPADPSVFGNAVSNGCVRAPSAAFDLLTQIPLGSPVVIS